MTGRRAWVLLVPAVVLVAMMLPLREGFTDDGFIHIQYARNIIERGEYSFNPGEVSFGTTSPLWVFELAAIGSFFHDREALVGISRVLSWLAGLAALLAVYAFALALGASRTTAVLAATAFAADPWFARWTALSMETSSAALAAALVGIASVRAWNDRRAAALLGVALALSSLIRPEFYLALPVWLLCAVTLGRRADRGAVLVTLGVAAALLVPWLLFARFYIGSFLPNTAGAKSGGLVTDPLTFFRKTAPVVKIVASGEGVAFLAGLVGLIVERRRSLVWSAPARFSVLWVVALPAAYVLFDVQILSRYLIVIAPMVCVLGWTSFERAARRLGVRRGRALVAGAVAVAIVVGAVFYARVVLPPSQEFSHDLTHNMKALALDLRAHSSPDAVVAAGDIGYLAFYSHRRVLDLGGLVEPATARLRAGLDYEEIVARGLYFDVPGYPQVDYLVDREHLPARFEGSEIARHRFEKVFMTTVRSLGIRKPGPWYYTLYHLTPVQ